jgi:hypothetical protein
MGRARPYLPVDLLADAKPGAEAWAEHLVEADDEAGPVTEVVTFAGGYVVYLAPPFDQVIANGFGPEADGEELGIGAGGSGCLDEDRLWGLLGGPVGCLKEALDVGQFLIYDGHLLCGHFEPPFLFLFPSVDGYL